MEHFIRIAFWIVPLFGCHQTKSLPIADLKIDFMKANVTCQPNSTFYAPTNVKGECITTALDCVRSELNGTVKGECTNPNEYIDQALDFLDYVIQRRLDKGHALTDSRECACEAWSQTPFITFLDKTENLVQLHNAVP